MYINEILNVINNLVCGGEDFQANIMKERGLRCIFFQNTKNQEIGSFIVAKGGEVLNIEFVAEVFIAQANINTPIMYRWQEPMFSILSAQESQEKSIDNNIGWNDVVFTDIKTEYEIKTILSNVMSEEKIEVSLSTITKEKSQLIDEEDVVDLNSSFNTMSELDIQNVIDNWKENELSEQLIFDDYENEVRYEEAEAIEYLKKMRDESIKKFKEKYPNGATIEFGNFLL